jgi:adenine-specific DNA-methyltransferase
MAKQSRGQNSPAGRTVETLTHGDDKRKNIPTAEYQSVVKVEQLRPVRVEYERRNRDLDPQLVWRGKDEQDWSDLVVHAPPLYIQEKVHPKVLVDDLLRQSRGKARAADPQNLLVPDLYADFNGVPEGDARTEFYEHDANWSNRMILGDSLQVMASLAEREGLRGKVQCIYFDPPYGIKFNSNFQWSTTSRDVKDGKADHITREPEQVKAFRDTWRDGIHSYLTYLRDRLTVARDLLTDSGSIFVQIGDENVHRVRSLLDEIFGESNFVSEIAAAKTSGLAASGALASGHDYVLHYAKQKDILKYRELFVSKSDESAAASEYFNVQLPSGTRRRMTSAEKDDPSLLPQSALVYRVDNLTKPGPGAKYDFAFRGTTFSPKARWWGTTFEGMSRVQKADRLHEGGSTISFVRFLDDFSVKPITNYWRDVILSSRVEDKVYVVQTSVKLIQRCILMSTDPGDLVLDPTCGSGSTASAAEQWGRRWITIDTSRVALALARARIMGARYLYYLLADSRDGQLKEAEVTRSPPSSQAVHSNVRQGFVYERVPHVTLKSIANNAEIDVIWEKWQAILEPLREALNTTLKKAWQEWEIPREADGGWSESAKKLHADWWQARISRQKEIDASIAAKAEFEYLYDKPYQDNKKVRVAGPFTVESLSPHRTLGVDENDDLIDPLRQTEAETGRPSFAQMILENLKTAGVQQAHKEDRITFTALVPWPGELICAEGQYLELGPQDPKGPVGNGLRAVPEAPSDRTRAEERDDQRQIRGEEGDDRRQVQERHGVRSLQRRAGIFIGPEFGTVQRQDLVGAAREAADAGFDVLIACAFNYDALSTEFNKLGRIPILKARMNADLHMAEDLKNTGKGNLFVIFGEPDIAVLPEKDGRLRVKINGVDVFHPNTGEVLSDGPSGIACWFIDTDYNEESFFVRHAYFLGQNDPYGALKTTLKAEINAEAWETLHSDTSRTFDRPESGRIAVKVINHLGDEVMKVFRV